MSKNLYEILNLSDLGESDAMHLSEIFCARIASRVGDVSSEIFVPFLGQRNIILFGKPESEEQETRYLSRLLNALDVHACTPTAKLVTVTLDHIPTGSKQPVSVIYRYSFQNNVYFIHFNYRDVCASIMGCISPIDMQSADSVERVALALNSISTMAMRAYLPECYVDSLGWRDTRRPDGTVSENVILRQVPGALTLMRKKIATQQS